MYGSGSRVIDVTGALDEEEYTRICVHGLDAGCEQLSVLTWSYRLDGRMLKEKHKLSVRASEDFTVHETRLGECGENTSAPAHPITSRTMHSWCAEAWHQHCESHITRSLFHMFIFSPTAWNFVGHVAVDTRYASSCVYRTTAPLYQHETASSCSAFYPLCFKSPVAHSPPHESI